MLLFFEIAFDNRTKSAREIWRQMQATRYHKANPKLQINTEVLGTAAPPEVVFKFIDDTEVSLDTFHVPKNEFTNRFLGRFSIQLYSQ